MENGKVLKSLVLALSAAWLGGCDVNAVQSLQTPAAQAAAIPEGPRLVDAGRGRIWSLTREGLVLRDIASTEKRSIALPGWIAAGTPFGFEPALVAGPGGDILVTSDVLPVIWRVDQRSLAVSVHALALDAHRDKDVGFTSLVYSPRLGAFVATSTVAGTRWRIDAGLTRAEQIRQ